MIPTNRPAASPAADRGRAMRCSAILAACCELLLATASHAEKADRDKPINLEADRVTVDDAKQV